MFKVAQVESCTKSGLLNFEWPQQGQHKQITHRQQESFAYEHQFHGEDVMNLVLLGSF